MNKQERVHRGDTLTKDKDQAEKPIPIGKVNRNHLRYDSERGMFYQLKTLNGDIVPTSSLEVKSKNDVK